MDAFDRGRQGRAPHDYVLLRYDAERSLATLDTEEAIRERVRRLKMPSEREWRRHKGNGYAGVDGRPVRLSTRPDLVAAAMEARALEPDFAVQFGYVVAWAEVLTQRYHPELSSALRGAHDSSPAITFGKRIRRLGQRCSNRWGAPSYKRQASPTK